MSTERGRPRSFDIDTALEQATHVFWRHGFQGASMAELTEATGLSKPSLYAAFGDKEALYLRCLQRYVERQVALQTALLEDEPDARRAVEGFVRTMAAMQSDPKLPGGCFVVNGTADCGNPATPAAVEAALRKASDGAAERLLKRLQQAERQGELPPGTDAKRLARLFGTLLTGMAVMAKAGQPRARLEEAVDAAMMVWPAGRKKAAR
ncbi:MAG: TetR/AcrR family transcriptional regulator [Pseudomonadota bacterium]